MLTTFLTKIINMNILICVYDLFLCNIQGIEEDMENNGAMEQQQSRISSFSEVQGFLKRCIFGDYGLCEPVGPPWTI